MSIATSTGGGYWLQVHGSARHQEHRARNARRPALEAPGPGRRPGSVNQPGAVWKGVAQFGFETQSQSGLADPAGSDQGQQPSLSLRLRRSSRTGGGLLDPKPRAADWRAPGGRRQPRSTLGMTSRPDFSSATRIALASGYSAPIRRPCSQDAKHQYSVCCRSLSTNMSCEVGIWLSSPSPMVQGPTVRRRPMPKVSAPTQSASWSQCVWRFSPRQACPEEPTTARLCDSRHAQTAL